jgi:hypothetical protein
VTAVIRAPIARARGTGFLNALFQVPALFLIIKTRLVLYATSRRPDATLFRASPVANARVAPTVGRTPCRGTQARWRRLRKSKSRTSSWYARAPIRFDPTPPPPPSPRRALPRVRPFVFARSNRVHPANPTASPFTPLSHGPQAARYGDLTDVQSWLSQGVSADAVDGEGRTALFFASANGHLEVVSYLLGKDADPNMANEQGGTAMHWACVNGHGDVVTALLEAGAKTTLVNAGGRTAMDEAMHNDRVECVDAIMKHSGAEDEDEEDDIEIEGEEVEDMGPETEADR